MIRSIALFFLLAGCHLCAVAGFDGTWIYRDDGAVATATITVLNGRLHGHVQEDGAVYPFTGTVAGNRAAIQLSIEGEQVPATLTLVDGDLIAELDGERYRYQRMAVAPAPEAAPPQRAAPAPVADGRRPAPSANGPVVLERKTLTDPGVNNMPSHTILVPKGWQVKGGAWWAAPAFFKVLPSQDITITAPDGTELHIAPTIAASDFRPSAEALNSGGKRPAEGQSDNGYPVLHQPDDEAGWRRKLTQVISQAWPTATSITIDDITVIPSLTAILHQRLQPLIAQQQPGGFVNGTVYAASIHYTNAGATWEQINVFGITNIGFDSMVGRSLYWTIEPNVSYRAPAGQLTAAMPLLIALANSLGHTPEWTRMANEHARKINQAASFKPSVLADTGKSASDILFEGWKQREASSNQSQRRIIESIHEVNTYATDTGSVQLPAGYNSVYSNGQGDYILSNNSLYQPSTDTSINQQNWQTIQVKP